MVEIGCWWQVGLRWNQFSRLSEHYLCSRPLTAMKCGSPYLGPSQFGPRQNYFRPISSTMWYNGDGNASRKIPNAHVMYTVLLFILFLWHLCIYLISTNSSSRCAPALTARVVSPAGERSWIRSLTVAVISKMRSFWFSIYFLESLMDSSFPDGVSNLVAVS